MGDNKGVSETAVVCGVLHFFSENVTAVDGTWNVDDANGTVDVLFANFDFAEVDMFDAFVCDRRRPVDAGLVIVVNGGGVNGVCHAKVFGTQADVQYFLGTFVGGKNFCLA